MQALLELNTKELATALGASVVMLCVMAPMMWLIIKRLVSTSAPLKADSIDDKQYSSLLRDALATVKPHRKRE